MKTANQIIVPKIQLNSNTAIPVMGFGTWQLNNNVCYSAVRKALQIGYRHIDTAADYGNHREIGRAIKDSHIPRKALFLTSKVWRENLHAGQVRQSCLQALEELETDYLDLYLIHWPNRNVPIAETMDALGRLQDERLVRSIGVSNFNIAHLKEARKTGVKFVVNQVEFHPSLNQKLLKEYCDDMKIVITAYSPIAQGQDLKLDLIRHLAKKYGRSEAQVILNWIISKGMVAIPRSKTPENILDNFLTLRWKLKPDDVSQIDDIGGNNRLLNPPFAEFED